MKTPEPAADVAPVDGREGTPAPGDGTTAPRDAAGPRPRLRGRALLQLARPRQWVKNVLVFAVPAADGILGEPGPFARSVVAFVAFSLAAAGTYFVNDARDVEADRRHPAKRHRPVASGTVPVRTAYVGGAILMAAAVALSFAASVELAAVVAAYIALTTAYSVGLKHVAVVDIVAVAAGFVLRAIAGAAATGAPMSEWFFIVASFGALFMVSGKRSAEVREMGDGASDTRSVLDAYSSSYTAYLRSMTSGVVLVAYSLWAFEQADLSRSAFPWFQISILPFALAILRYALVLDRGRGSAPEDIILGDRSLQLIGVAWAAVFAVGVYTA